MNNFKTSVPSDLITKLSELSQAIVLRDIIGGSVEGYGEQRIEEIQGNYVSGWIPKQDGGFTVDELYSNSTDENITEKQKEYNWKQYQDCFAQFIYDVLSRSDDDDSEVLHEDLTEEEKEQFYDYEREWFEPCLVQVQMFVDGYGEYCGDDKQVTIRLSVNYKDTPYYREKYAEDMRQVILEIDEFMAIDNQAIIDQLKGK